MKLEIIRGESSREIECDDARVEDGLLYIYRAEQVVEIWNMKKIEGVVYETGVIKKTVYYHDQRQVYVT